MSLQTMRRFEFPVGYRHFHRKQLFNYQLNRWYSFGYAAYGDFLSAGRRIKTFGDWQREMLQLAEHTASGGDLLRAAFYYRAAEFYLLDDVPEKTALYDRFQQLFYAAIGGDPVERLRVPYAGTFLPLIKVPAQGDCRGTIVLHGGFDSFIEEFYSMMCFLAGAGYDVIAFEGPGQGAARRQGGLAFDIAWEKPVSVVLDHLRLTQVTLLGISMGGWLALRAAAGEPRIARVIANGHAIDYMKGMNRVLRWIHLYFLNNHRDFMERMTEKKFLGPRENMASWMVKHLMYITKKEKPLDALETYLAFSEKNMQPERIVQDVLLLHSRKDHFVPFKMQVAALSEANSVTTRVFTAQEHAHNHCQVGNIALSLVVMLQWLNTVT